MFSERLKRLRTEKGITQKELADRLHISRSTIAGYESLGKEPDGEKLCALADFFGVSVDYLLGGTDSREPISPTPAPPSAAQRRRRPQSPGSSAPCLIGSLTGSWGIFRR